MYVCIASAMNGKLLGFCDRCRWACKQHLVAVHLSDPCGLEVSIAAQGIALVSAEPHRKRVLVGSNVIALSALVNFPGVVRAKACPESIGSLLWFGISGLRPQGSLDLEGKAGATCCVRDWLFFVWALFPGGCNPKNATKPFWWYIWRPKPIYSPLGAPSFLGLRTARQASSPFLMWTGH